MFRRSYINSTFEVLNHNSYLYAKWHDAISCWSCALMILLFQSNPVYVRSDCSNMWFILSFGKVIKINQISLRVQRFWRPILKHKSIEIVESSKAFSHINHCHLSSGISGWWPFICALNVCPWLNCLLHPTHWNRLKSLWTHMCWVKFFFLGKDLEHTLQWKARSPVCTSWCCSKYLLDANFRPQ